MVFSVVDDTVVVDNETNDDCGDDVAPVCDVVDDVVLETDDVAVDSTVDDIADDDSIVALVVVKVIGDDDENVDSIIVVVGDDVSSLVVTITVYTTALETVAVAIANKTALRTIANFDESRLFSPNPKLKLPKRVPKQKQADDHR